MLASRLSGTLSPSLADPQNCVYLRDSKLLDPSVDPARVRAMYTNPEYARRGVGHLILSLCEAAAAAEGFTRLELMRQKLAASRGGERRVRLLQHLGEVGPADAHAARPEALQHGPGR